MNRFLLLALTAGLLSPVAAIAKPIAKISDWDASFDQPYVLGFECPRGISNELVNGKLEKKKKSLYKSCWVTFHNDYMEIMDKQKIYRKDVLRYFFLDETPPNSGRTWDVHHFIYKDKDSNVKLFKATIKKNPNFSDLVSPKGNKYLDHQERSETKKLWRVPVQRDVINHWMAQ